MNDIVRRLNLSKQKSIQLASVLKSFGLLTGDCLVEYFQHRDLEILHLFEEYKGKPFLKDIQGYFNRLNIEYNPDQYRKRFSRIEE